MKYLPPDSQWAPRISNGELLVAHQRYTLTTFKNGEYTVVSLPIWEVDRNLVDIIAFMLDEEII